MATRELKLSFTPDPDDAFAWWAIATGHLTIPGHSIKVETRHLQEANRGCMNGELDIAAISVAAYPFFHREYEVLEVGASVGRGYGPALAVRTDSPGNAVRGPVAIPGANTTGALMFRLFFPGIPTVEMGFHEVAGAILRGDVAAGVLIHEELLNWEHKGLRRVLCLGKEWQRRSGLPLPVGLIAVRRSLGSETIGNVATALRQSIELAAEHREEALRWALGFTRQSAGGIGELFVDMFTNSDTLCMPPDCRVALRELYRHASLGGLIPDVPDSALPSLELTIAREVA
jgi:1,4-dihydroxy-6-naphthoate synthase